MKTEIYFVVHGEANIENKDYINRELTSKGIDDSEYVSAFLEETKIDGIISSPYKRAFDTVAHLSQERNLEIVIEDGLRAQIISNSQVSDLEKFYRLQWLDRNYKYKDGESLAQVQSRSVKIIAKLLDEVDYTKIVVATHTKPLCTILNYYDDNYDYDFLCKVNGIYPLIIQCSFENQKLICVSNIETL